MDNFLPEFPTGVDFYRFMEEEVQNMDEQNKAKQIDQDSSRDTATDYQTVQSQVEYQLNLPPFLEPDGLSRQTPGAETYRGDGGLDAFDKTGIDNTSRSYVTPATELFPRHIAQQQSPPVASSGNAKGGICIDLTDDDLSCDKHSTVPEMIQQENKKRKRTIPNDQNEGPQWASTSQGQPATKKRRTGEDRTKTPDLVPSSVPRPAAQLLESSKQSTRRRIIAKTSKNCNKSRTTNAETPLHNLEALPEHVPRPTSPLVHQPSQAKRVRKFSKLAARLAKVDGPAGANRAAKGLVRTNGNGQLEWRPNESDPWVRAGYHRDYRQEFINMDASQLGSYVHPPKAGKESEPLNVTSYCPDQRTWTPDKGTIIDNKGRQILHMIDAPEDFVHNPKVDHMMHNGLVMLDHDNHPVRDFPGVPRCFSTEIEAWRLEGLRRCTGMIITDFMARMPAIRKTRNGTAGLQKMSAFTNRMERYRIVEQVATWKERGEESKKLKKFIKDQLADPNAKTTESLPRLTSAQQKAAFDLNRNQFWYRSRYEHPEAETSTTAPIDLTIEPNHGLLPPSTDQFTSGEGTLEVNEPSVDAFWPGEGNEQSLSDQMMSDPPGSRSSHLPNLFHNTHSQDNGTFTDLNLPCTNTSYDMSMQNQRLMASYPQPAQVYYSTSAPSTRSGDIYGSNRTSYGAATPSNWSQSQLYPSTAPSIYPNSGYTVNNGQYPNEFRQGWRPL